MNLMHRRFLSGEVVVVESYLAPVDFEIQSTRGERRTIRLGTWLLGITVVDQTMWEQVQSGTLDGFSIQGHATKTPL